MRTDHRADPLHSLPAWDPNQYDREIKAERQGRAVGEPPPKRNVAEPVWQPNKNAWLMRFTHKGQFYLDRFPTKQAAIAWRDQIRREEA